MDSSTDQNNNRKIIYLSILAGIRYAIGGLLLGTIIPAIAVFLFYSVGTRICFEGCAFLITGVSPIVGLVTALIIGIGGGKRTYKRLSAKN